MLATWSKVANTVPEDVDGFSAWTNSILVAKVMDAEAAHIIAAILAVPGILPITPAAGASVADALLDAAMQVQTRSHLPATGAIVSPDTFARLATAKASTSGVYLSGLPLSASPSMVLWVQLQLVVSAAMAAGTALVVAGRAGALHRKGTLGIDISDSNEDDFIKNLLTAGRGARGVRGVPAHRLRVGDGARRRLVGESRVRSSSPGFQPDRPGQAGFQLAQDAGFQTQTPAVVCDLELVLSLDAATRSPRRRLVARRRERGG